MSTKDRMRMEIKEVSEDGVFEGLLSPYGNVDGGRDVVEPGAYAKTLKEHGNKVPMLWQHRHDIPIGILELEDRADGLWCKGRLEMSLEKAREAYTCLKSEIIKGLSIGYESVKDEVKDGIRRLKEIRLWEGSIVTFPMNELAQVTSVKTAFDILDSDDDFEMKVGAAISAVTAARLKSACEKILTAHNEIAALCEDKAGSTTLSDKAAEDSKPEPADDHSAMTGIIEGIRALIPK